MGNAINWFDIPTLDFDRAVKFYSTILGEELRVGEHMGHKLAFFPCGGGQGVGGDLAPPSPEFKPSAEGARVYLNCEGKLDTVISRVEKAGGTIIKPKFNIGEAGWVAMIMDSEGNKVGLHSFK